MDPKNMIQEQRQALWDAAGHSGQAPVGYGGEGGASGGGNVAPFNFDYVKAATDAYGELGVYYDRLLRESKGDLNIALARLTEDYDKGIRIQTEDTNTANTATAQSNQNNALARGLYQKSLFDPFSNPEAPTAGMGLADMANPNNPYGQTVAQRKIDLTRFKDTAGTTLARTKTDKTTEQQRYELNLEQQRRQESASMAETRGARALNKWNADQMILA
jgi:hypothetical protein